MIDDYEPEDAWDASDAPHEQATNLARRVALLDGEPVPTARSIESLLDVIHDRVERARRSRQLDGRAVLRVAQLLDDLRFVRSRL